MFIVLLFVFGLLEFVYCVFICFVGCEIGLSVGVVLLHDCLLARLL